MFFRKFSFLLFSMTFTCAGFAGEVEQLIYGYNLRAGTPESGAGWVKPMKDAQYHYDVKVSSNHKTATVQFPTGPQSILKGRGEIDSIVKDIDYLNEHVAAKKTRILVIESVEGPGGLHDVTRKIDVDSKDLSAIREKLTQLSKGPNQIRAIQYQVPLKEKGTLKAVTETATALKNRMRAFLRVQPSVAAGNPSIQGWLKNMLSKIPSRAQPLVYFLGLGTVTHHILGSNVNAADLCSNGKVLCDRTEGKPTFDLSFSKNTAAHESTATEGR